MTADRMSIVALRERARNWLNDVPDAPYLKADPMRTPREIIAALLAALESEHAKVERMEQDGWWLSDIERREETAHLLVALEAEREAVAEARAEVQYMDTMYKGSRVEVERLQKRISALDRMLLAEQRVVGAAQRVMHLTSIDGTDTGGHFNALADALDAYDATAREGELRG